VLEAHTARLQQVEISATVVGDEDVVVAATVGILSWAGIRTRWLVPAPGSPIW
jgi:hypothetical protein